MSFIGKLFGGGKSKPQAQPQATVPAPTPVAAPQVDITGAQIGARGGSSSNVLDAANSARQTFLGY